MNEVFFDEGYVSIQLVKTVIISENILNTISSVIAIHWVEESSGEIKQCGFN